MKTTIDKKPQYTSYRDLPEHLVTEYADKKNLNIETHENYREAAIEVFKKLTGKKYNYLLVIQQSYGQGWEDCSEYEANSSFKADDKQLLKHDLVEYKLLSYPIGYPTRVISRKKLNPLYINKIINLTS